MTSAQETEWVYSYNPGACIGRLCHNLNVTQTHYTVLMCTMSKDKCNPNFNLTLTVILILM